MQQNLARKNLEKRLAPLRKADLMPPSRGWLRAIREALGMTGKQLGERLGVVPSRITALEQAEVTGKTTLSSLREAAEAMGCTLVYAIVPTRPMDDMLHERALALANEALARVNHTMRLEDQALDTEALASERARMIQQFINDNPRRLWERP